MASKEKGEKNVVVPRSAAAIQKFKLEKLMKNPAKPVLIHDAPAEKLPRVFNPPEFIRNIWGSSAGAGSGDFHVYRGVRRREYARQKFMDAKSVADAADQDYHKKVDENKKAADDKTDKKRAKRLKKKWKQKQSKKLKKNEDSAAGKKTESDGRDDDSEEDSNETTDVKE